jgi:hypothetical protein
MNKIISSLVGLAVLSGSTVSGQLLLSGIGDGPLSGGVPKFLEIFVQTDVADLSTWSIGNYNNGNVTVGTESPLSGSATAGSFIYVASEETGFTNFFGFAPDFTSNALNVNGDDAMLLSNNGSGVDVFGEIGVDGTGQAWEYADGWAYRQNTAISATTTFDTANWLFSGPDALDGETSNATAATSFPIGSFSPVPEPSTYAALLGLLALGVVAYRRRKA